MWWDTDDIICFHGPLHNIGLYSKDMFTASKTYMHSYCEWEPESTTITYRNWPCQSPWALSWESPKMGGGLAHEHKWSLYLNHSKIEILKLEILQKAGWAPKWAWAATRSNTVSSQHNLYHDNTLYSRPQVSWYTSECVYAVTCAWLVERALGHNYIM